MPYYLDQRLGNRRIAASSKCVWEGEPRYLPGPASQGKVRTALGRGRCITSDADRLGGHYSRPPVYDSLLICLFADFYAYSMLVTVGFTSKSCVAYHVLESV